MAPSFYDKEALKLSSENTHPDDVDHEQFPMHRRGEGDHYVCDQCNLECLPHEQLDQEDLCGAIFIENTEPEVYCGEPLMRGNVPEFRMRAPSDPATPSSSS